MNYFDEQEIRKTISILKPDGQLFEVRVIFSGGQTLSGYFRDVDVLLRELRSINLRDSNVYISLNTLKDACYGRTQHDHFEKSAKTATSDKDVNGYDWLFVDLDPERVSGTSSSDAELQAAKMLGNKIYLALKNLGFEKPITAMSGNGVHLLYKIHLFNNDENKELLKKCLVVLDALFSTDLIKVDLKNFNAARVCKLYGCLASKGANTAERPHRMSYIIGDAERDVKVTDIAYLKKLADLIPDETDRPQQYNRYSPSTFDVEEWMNRHGIAYKPVSTGDGTKYILEHCPFDENHKGKDAVVFRRNNGALAFVCLHSSCSDKHWKEFRQHFEPNAYERREQEQYQKMYYSFNRDRKPLPEPPKIKEQDGEPVFYNAEMVMDLKVPEETFIRTGIEIIDKKMRGLAKGHVSVWSGLRASAKSTLLSQISLTARQDGNNVAFFSGELRPKDFMRWMFQQAAGKGYVQPSQYEGFYNTPIDVQRKIAKWLGQHFWLYNNSYGNSFTAVMEQFDKIIEEKKLDLLVLDNLMAFDISDLGYTKWDAQSKFVLSLASKAKKKNLHIAFVAHPKKSQGFLRFDDISGTADLGNAVDDAFIVHRNNNDFKRLSKDMFDWSEQDEVYSGTNVVEIVKDRSGGTQDVFVPLFYEVESKRLKNYEAENVIYGWHSPTLDDLEMLPNEGGENPFA